MSITKTREKVRDGFLGDLPDDLQSKVMNIHKLIKNTVHDILDDPNYADLKESKWAMSCIDEFCAMPKDKSDIGSVRVYKSGKAYRCMIQATGHFRNHQYGWIEELLHDFIKNVYATVRPNIRRKYDMTITNEGRTGQPYEGFDIYPNPKTVKDIWDRFEDKKTKTITEEVDDGIIEYSQDLADYYEFYSKIGIDEFFYERSHGKLKNSFRIGVNPENGHFIKIVFDLNPSNILQVGDHANQDLRNSDKDRHIAKNITKTGHNDFSSRAMVKAIVDMDTKQPLQTVRTIGVIGSNSNTTRFSVPDEFVDPNLRDESKTFSAYPVATREKIAKKLNLNPPDAITFKVGEMEQVPSYKATIAARSISGLYNNQWKKGRGVETLKKLSQRVNSDVSIHKAIGDIEKKFTKIKPSLDMGDDDVDFNVRLYNKSIKKIHQVMDENKNDNFGQSVGDPRYNSLYRRLEDLVSDLEDTVKPVKESYIDATSTPEYNVDMTESSKDISEGSIKDLPKGFSALVNETAAEIKDAFNDITKTEKYKTIFKNQSDIDKVNNWLMGKGDPNKVGSTFVEENDGLFGEVIVSPKPKNALFDDGELQKAYIDAIDDIIKKMAIDFDKKNPGKRLKFSGVGNGKYIAIQVIGEYAKKLKSYLEDPKENPLTEAATGTPEYNVDMTEAEAKRTLRTLSQTIINDTANKKDYKVSQYTANIYANIITKNLLPVWAKGFRKFSITLDSYQSFFTFEFKTPPMTQDFVSRFVAGRESINGFIHRNAEIKVKMSPRIFHTMKNPDDAFNFFKSAIKYYDSGLEKASERLMVEVMRLNREMKHLISTTKLSGIVTYPMSLLFVFDDVKMDTKDTFRISQEDIKTINQFVKGIYTKYASPDKERRKIVDDVKDMVKALRESCDPENETISALKYLPEAVEKYLFEGYSNELKEFNEKWIYEQLDLDWSRKQQNGQVQYLQEKFGVKKLKKIPTDLVAYITIEAESIKDANDKMMISSYCLGKIEIVEWYIELLEVGSKKYIVPHTKPYLESVRTQLLACFKKIMDTPIPKNNRPLIDIQYPKGYEG